MGKPPLILLGIFLLVIPGLTPSLLEEPWKIPKFPARKKPPKPPKDPEAAFPALGKAPGWVWNILEGFPGIFTSHSREFFTCGSSEIPKSFRIIPGQTFPGYPNPKDPAVGSSSWESRGNPWMHQTPTDPQHSQFQNRPKRRGNSQWEWENEP